jgi:lipopolysaccharide biosynthesis glycosyltransferase
LGSLFNAKIILPEVLPRTIDRLLYVDSDTVFVGNIVDLWNEWKGNNDTSLEKETPVAAMIADHDLVQFPITRGILYFRIGIMTTTPRALIRE